jgi:DNA-binding MarR family transcriptional regulator
MLIDSPPQTVDAALQEQMIAFIRAFGLHRPDQTPCGEPVSIAEAHALMELARAEPLTQHDLAHRLRLEKSTVSRLAGMLERRQWIVRTKSPRDGRALELRLTGAGRQAAADLATARQAKFAAMLAAIPEDEREAVVKSLRTLVEAMYASG